MDNIVQGPWDGYLPEGHQDAKLLDPDEILELAKNNYKYLVVVGINKEGELDLRSNLPSTAEANLLCNKAVHWFVTHKFTSHSE